MPDPLPQPVLAPLTPAAICLVATIDKGGEEAVHDALPDISGLVRAIGFRDPAKRLSAVTSIGAVVTAAGRCRRPVFGAAVGRDAVTLLPRATVFAPDTPQLSAHFAVARA